MAKYKVDKQMFEQNQIEEQQKNLELHLKFLRNELLTKKEVDEYNRINANNWIKNVLVSFGTIFATLVMLIITILLGSLLFTSGRQGVLTGTNVDSTTVYHQFITDINKHEVVEVPRVDDNNEPILDESGKQIIDKVNVYDIPMEFEPGKQEIFYSYQVPYDLLEEKVSDPVIVHYRVVKVTIDGLHKRGLGVLAVNGSRGVLDPSTSIHELSNGKKITYVLDNNLEKITFTKLLDDYYKTMPDGNWAKAIVSPRLLGSSGFLVGVLIFLYFAIILGYMFILVVGIRYIIRAISSVLKKAGYLASDFVTEFTSAVKNEIPIIDTERAEELDMEYLSNKLKSNLKGNENFVTDSIEEEQVDEFADLFEARKNRRNKKVEPEVKVEEVVETKVETVETKVETVEIEPEVKQKEEVKPTPVEEIGNIFDL